MITNYLIWMIFFTEALPLQNSWIPIEKYFKHEKFYLIKIDWFAFFLFLSISVFSQLSLQINTQTHTIHQYDLKTQHLSTDIKSKLIIFNNNNNEWEKTMFSFSFFLLFLLHFK